MTRQVMISKDPFEKGGVVKGSPFSFYQWPASWIYPHQARPDRAVVFGARLSFVTTGAQLVTLHVSGDQRFELFLDGERVARGPELGDLGHWHFSSFVLELAPGPHALAARVWYAADGAGYAQQSCRPAFLCAASGPGGEAFHTGKAPWRVREFPGFSFERPRDMFLAPPRMDFDTAQNVPDWLTSDDGWEEPAVGSPAQTEGHTDTRPEWVLRPAQLPPQREKAVPWGEVSFAGERPAGDRRPFFKTEAGAILTQKARAWAQAGEPLEIPKKTSVQILIDAQTYRCAWPVLPVSGGKGAEVSLKWAESLFCKKLDEKDHGTSKGHRGEVEGKTFYGFGDGWVLDGRGHRLESGIWKAGRFILLEVTTENEPVLLGPPELVETGYPLDFESQVELADPGLEEAIPIMKRALVCCSHETYMDCPYYERMMYVGDTRLEALVTYVSARDARLPLKALTVFDQSRQSLGLTASRYPTRHRQTIPPFSLWWVAMVHDHARWRNEPSAVKSLLPGVRGVVEYFLARIGEDGLPQIAPGWNFQDWVPGWPAGTLPEGRETCLMGWHLVYTLGLAAELEREYGEDGLAVRLERHRGALAAVLDKTFWSAQRGLWADDRQHRHHSEHVPCLAILSGVLTVARQKQVAEAMLRAKDLDQTTIYYSHYFFEAMTRVGRMGDALARMDLWRGLGAQGFVTTPECPEPSRSDCHAWGAHPLYHFFASVLGIRPGGFGFGRIRIEPQLGNLSHARGTMVHPQGEVRVSVEVQNGKPKGFAQIPGGCQGTLVWNGAETEFQSRIDF